MRITHHGPLVNAALGADESEPLALRWQTLDQPTAFAGMFDLHGITSGPELVARLEGHSSPASNLIWADRHGSIGYKLIGRLPLRKGGCAGKRRARHRRLRGDAVRQPLAAGD